MKIKTYTEEDKKRQSVFIGKFDFETDMKISILLHEKFRVISVGISDNIHCQGIHAGVDGEFSENEIGYLQGVIDTVKAIRITL